MSTASVAPKTPKAPKAKAAPKAAAKTPAAPKAPAAAKPKAGGGITVKVRQAADALKMVSDATRLQIVILLDAKPHNVGELCTALGDQSQPAVSHHLALMRHGRVVVTSRDGKHNIYSLTHEGEAIAKVVKVLF